MLDLTSDVPSALRKIRKTVGNAIIDATAALRAAGCQTPALDARLLVAKACELSTETAIVNPNIEIEGKFRSRVEDFVERRLSGEPVSRILGYREFWGLPFKLTKETLDPRPDSETLVEAVLNYVKEAGLTGERLRLLDLGTGSGCLLAALLFELPLAQGVAVDRSYHTLLAARENLSHLGLLDRASFLCGDWAAAINQASFDIIVCNPPYIASGEIGDLETEVRQFDPISALDGGPDGFQAYREVIPLAVQTLRQTGFLILEVGRRKQGEKALNLMKLCQGAASFEKYETFRDLSGADRAVAGVRQSVTLE